MDEQKQFKQMKQNVLGLWLSLIDASFHGVSKEQQEAIKFSINKVLKGTELTVNDLIKEFK
ncbi:hypothetical protein [Bacillus sp. XF8]|uniref:hypothetical protein n=1 Tax=Bacillus sp. XF8 TaxID=2819289 RepID=UPI001AA0557B|nr:hypothetical protein [Bacillus sp. XF8]MBO1583035.1 hypothetical protein [Bacillus sp. XF8]